MVTPSTTTMQVLLVDDDPHACNVFQLVMDHYNLPLTIVHDAETALDYLHEHTPDIAVFDLFLPGIDGFQALKQIRSKNLVPSCRIIATTAYHTHDTVQEIQARGFDGYIAKPVNAQELIAYLESVLKQDK